MADLTIRMKKRADGTSALSCTRADGSVTWQVPKGAQGMFFGRHDLTHYAVETVLGQRDGFFGLLAAGWNISDFGPPWPRGPVPVAAGWVELIVGFLDMERAGGAFWSAAEFNDKARLYYSDHSTGRHGAPVTRALTDDELNAIRDRRRELFSEWAHVETGSALELAFNRP